MKNIKVLCNRKHTRSAMISRTGDARPGQFIELFSFRRFLCSSAVRKLNEFIDQINGFRVLEKLNFISLNNFKVINRRISTVNNLRHTLCLQLGWCLGKYPAHSGRFRSGSGRSVDGSDRYTSGWDGRRTRRLEMARQNADPAGRDQLQCTWPRKKREWKIHVHKIIRCRVFGVILSTVES